MAKKKTNRKTFYLVLVVLPLFILVILEFGLRLSGFGNSYPLFIPAKTLPGYMQPNPDIINRYFIDPGLAPAIKPDTIYFKQKKPADSFRIVIQGGSTAAGFPFGRFGSLSGMLQQRFKRLYPEKNIEIISTAMSAVNSYTLLDFVDEILDIEPDLVLIYAGHNEYLGIMGVGSAFASKGNRATTLMFLQMKEIRLFQLMQRFVSIFQVQKQSQDSLNQGPVEHTDVQPQKQANNRTLMAQVAKEKNIFLGSELYKRGLDQFSQNLDLILGKYQAAKVPVMISTLASNEKDQAPFASTEGEHSASAYYKRAKNFEFHKNYKQAKKAYQEARDRDLLRFRAPREFNNIIRKKASQSNIALVDAERRLRADSDHGIIGHALMFEHLHPNARGYFLLAESFVDKIVSQKLISKSVMSYTEKLAWQDIPLTKVDLIASDFKIRTLLSDYPFKSNKEEVKFGEANSFEEQVAVKKLGGDDWLTIHQEMLQHYQEQKNWREAGKIGGLIFDAFPDQHNAAYVAGQLYFRNKDFSMALYYHRKAIEIEPKKLHYLLATARSYFSNQKLEESMQMLERLLVIEPNHVQAKHQYQRIKALLNK